MPAFAISILQTVLTDNTINQNMDKLVQRVRKIQDAGISIENILDESVRVTNAEFKEILTKKGKEDIILEKTIKFLDQSGVSMDIQRRILSFWLKTANIEINREFAVGIMKEFINFKTFDIPLQKHIDFKKFIVGLCFLALFTVAGSIFAAKLTVSKLVIVYRYLHSKEDPITFDSYAFIRFGENDGEVYVAEFPQLGSKWEECGTVMPEGSRLLTNDKLAKALMEEKQEFTRQEWEAFGINDLQTDHVVQVESEHFKPVAQQCDEFIYLGMNDETEFRQLYMKDVANIRPLPKIHTTANLLPTAGLKWVECGTETPQGSRLLTNADLAEALKKKQEFTREELKAFEIDELPKNVVVRAGSQYFKPELQIGKIYHMDNNIEELPLGSIWEQCSSSQTTIQVTNSHLIHEDGYYIRINQLNQVFGKKAIQTNDVLLWNTMFYKPVTRRIVVSKKTNHCFLPVKMVRYPVGDTETCSICFDSLTTAGLNWEECGTDMPKGSRLLTNDKLTKALDEKQEFTRQEWEAFDINDLQTTDVVQVGSQYFKPVVTTDDSFCQLSCGHLFHCTCVENWLKTQVGERRCARCNEKDVSKKEGIFLFNPETGWHKK